MSFITVGLDENKTYNRYKNYENYTKPYSMHFLVESERHLAHRS